MITPPLHGTFTASGGGETTVEGYYVGEAQNGNNHRIIMFTMAGARVEKNPDNGAFALSTQGLQTLREAAINRFKAVQTI